MGLYRVNVEDGDIRDIRPYAPAETRRAYHSDGPIYFIEDELVASYEEVNEKRLELEEQISKTMFYSESANKEIRDRIDRQYTEDREASELREYERLREKFGGRE